MLAPLATLVTLATVVAPPAVAPLAVVPPLVAAPGGIDRLAFFNGTWRLDSDSRETPHSSPGHTTLTVATRCQRFMHHLACQQTVDGIPAGLVVFTFDPVSGRYASLGVRKDGSGTTSAVEVDGTRVTFPWTQDFNGATVHFRIVNTLTAPDTIAYRKDYSADGTTWLPVESGVERRIAP